MLKNKNITYLNLEKKLQIHLHKNLENTKNVTD